LSQFYIFCLEPLRILLLAKFGVSSFPRSADMEGSPGTQATPLLTQFNIFCFAPISFLLGAKFGVSSYVRYGDIEGSQNLKSRSRDPGHAPFDPILHYLHSTP